MNAKNFNVAGFKYPCYKTNKMQQVIINLSQKINDVIGLPAHANSGYRCEAHNKAVGGGIKNSYHSLGLVANLSCASGVLILFLAVRPR